MYWSQPGTSNMKRVDTLLTYDACRGLEVAEITTHVILQNTRARCAYVFDTGEEEEKYVSRRNTMCPCD